MPNLRFPEFKDAWDIITLSDVCEVYRGGAFSKVDMKEDGTELCIHYGELFTKYNEVISDIYSRTNKKDGVRSEAGDILMPSSDVTPDGLATASAITLDNVVLGGDMNIIRPKTKINSIFLSYLLNYSKSEIIKLVSGTTVKHIYPSQIITCQLAVVNNESEQQKIAACLSSLDDLIAAHNQKLEALKDHKKGLMQNLFPQEGETVPKYRFKEFEKDGEWVEKKLGEIAELTSSKRVHLADYVSNGIPFFRGKEISQLKNNRVPDDILYISNEQYNEIKEKYGVPKKGDILITAVGTLGNVYCIKNDNEFYFKDGNLIWLKNISLDSNFIEVLLDVGKGKILASAIGSSQKALTMKALNKLKFQLPKKPNEQQKIADCLSSLDNLITAQSEKIEQLQSHKKGLMQGLFPKTDT